MKIVTSIMALTGVYALSSQNPNQNVIDLTEDKNDEEGSDKNKKKRKRKRDKCIDLTKKPKVFADVKCGWSKI